MVKRRLSKEENLLLSEPWSDHLCQKSSCRMRADACAELCHSCWLRSAEPQPWEGGFLQLLAHCWAGRTCFQKGQPWGTRPLMPHGWGPKLPHHHTLTTHWINGPQQRLEPKPLTESGLGWGSCPGTALIYGTGVAAGYSKYPVMYNWISHVTS